MDHVLRKLAITSASITVAAVVAIALLLVAIVAYWERPKEWDARSVTATGKGLSIALKAKQDGNLDATGFSADFVFQNNTRHDVTIPVDVSIKTRDRKDKSLGDVPSVRLQGGIFIPAHQSASGSIRVDAHCDNFSDLPACLRSIFPDVTEFVLFDFTNRYQITLPLNTLAASPSSDTYSFSFADVARTKLFRLSTLAGRMQLLRAIDASFASLDKSSQEIIVGRLEKETKNDPEFRLPNDAVCSLDKALFRSYGGALLTPCRHTIKSTGCVPAALPAPPNGYTLEDDERACFVVRGDASAN